MEIRIPYTKASILVNGKRSDKIGKFLCKGGMGKERM